MQQMLNKTNRRKNKTKFHKTQLTLFWREDNVQKQVTETKTVLRISLRHTQKKRRIHLCYDGKNDVR